eukprot:CAMPEP_0168573144 /NCGR_PEP_ID=MMETSP0413-20121227/18362_1 /TAXON_ID=136452 /ORGANISM="Filamoeba nolandi, Strain NC-AS-23-1" /LENGTH=489 /DNA_ID=CAMNT_0008606343 /DNA_START=583 /DNA_END=2049 /DNA_ORIENTATION=-
MKVIVIGAGMAGLSAALELLSQGVDVIVLEGRNRIGGRITKSNTFEVPIDLGASWIHGVDGNPLTPIAHSLGLRLDVTDNPRLTAADSFKVYDSEGKLLDKALDESVRSRFDMMEQEGLKILKSLDRDVSVETLFALASKITRPNFVEHEQPLVNWIKSGIEGWENTNLDTISSRSHFGEHDVTPFSGGDGFMMDGFWKMIEELAKPLEGRILLNHVVQNVQYNSSGVHIETTAGSYAADYAICTLPLGVLKSGAVNFIPPLPASKQKAIKSIGFGCMNKLVLEFPEVFWDADSDGFGYVSKNTLGEYNFFMNIHKLIKKPILMCFVAADFAYAVETKSDAQIAEEIYSILNKVFGKPGQPVPRPTAVTFTRWATDQFARGSYSFMHVGSSEKDVQRLGKPVDRLHFAGEATFHSVGYVHGAYISGKREAKNILEHMKQQATNVPTPSSTSKQVPVPRQIHVGRMPLQLQPQLASNNSDPNSLVPPMRS